MPVWIALVVIVVIVILIMIFVAIERLLQRNWRLQKQKWAEERLRINEPVTLEVEEKDANGTFTPNGLKLTHQECSGGKVKISLVSSLTNKWTLECLRCKEDFIFSDSLLKALIQTAVDGETREVEFMVDSSWGSTKYHITVVRKTQI